jgi:LacI family transcriptional regulator
MLCGGFLCGGLDTHSLFWYDVTVNGNDNETPGSRWERRGVKQKTTIGDVAAAAGVSHQTVSRVINNRPDVAAKTRRRVWQVIEELNYQPSAVARSLIRQRSHTVGVVIAGLQYIGPSRTLSGIIKQVEEMEYTLLLKELPNFYAKDIGPLLKALQARQVDGIIWAAPEIGSNRDWLQSWPPGLSMPTIFLTMQARPGWASVSIDNYAGGCAATEHLLEQGYRHIGHVAGPLDWWEARQRKAGWRDALYRAQMPVADHHWAAGDWSASSGERAIKQLLVNYPGMDALFVANDQMALGVLQVVCREGLRVPQDLAIVGFDGIPESAYYWLPLTTVHQDQQELGCVAVRELIRMIDASHQDGMAVEPKAILLRPRLVVRESSVPADS